MTTTHRATDQEQGYQECSASFYARLAVASAAAASTSRLFSAVSVSNCSRYWRPRPRLTWRSSRNGPLWTIT